MLEEIMLGKVYVPNNRGFCGGVEVAIRAVEDLAKKHPDETVYNRHPIIHNSQEVQRLKDEFGVVTVEDISQIPRGSRVVFSAHGTSKEVYAEAEARDLIVTDATCFLVTKVHTRAIYYHRLGYEIILIGHDENHAEVVGTRSRAPMHLVESVEDVANLDIPPGKKIAFITQTTLSELQTKEIKDALRTKYGSRLVTARDDICYATTYRQQAVQAVRNKFNTDAFLIVGGNTSSNVGELVNTARGGGGRAYLIETFRDITDEHLEGVVKLGLTSGASTPPRLLEGVKKYLQDVSGCEVVDYFHRKEEVNFPPIVLN